MKQILLTNDDGFEAEGIKALRKALQGIARVVVVAPAFEKSACGHSLSPTKMLKFKKIEEDFYKLDDGTPTDCVFMALHEIFKTKPDLIISGINHGANLGEDITYSGTCGACMEGVLLGIPSIAFSQAYLKNSLELFGFDLACEVALNLVQNIFENGFPLQKKEFLNVNIPPIQKEFYKGLILAPLGKRIYKTTAQKNTNPRGEEYFWLGNWELEFEPTKEQDSDIERLFQGYATITPVMLDLTAKNQMENLKFWLGKS